MQMKQSSKQHFWSAFFLSAFSKSCYRYIYHHWRWRALGYYLIVLMISFGLASIHVHHNLRVFYQATTERIAASLPSFTIQAGEAKNAQKASYPVFLPSTQWQVGLFDFTEAGQPPAQSSLWFMLTQKGVWLRQLTTNKLRFYPYTAQKTVVYNTQKYQAIFKKAEPMILAIFTFIYAWMGLVFSFLPLLLINLIYTWFSKQFSSLTRQTHQFWQLYYANLIGMTWPLFLFALGYALWGWQGYLLIFYFSAFLLYTLAVNIFTARRAKGA